MAINPDLLELPDHEHYPACSTRMTGINRICTRIFNYVLLTSIIICILSFTGINLPVISTLPSLLSTSFEVPFMFFQVFEMIAMVIIAGLGYGRYKICNVILFILYALMLIVGIFSKNFPGNLFTLIIGAGGTAQTFRAYGIYSDFEQLKKTEGYPHFNLRFTESIEHPDYASRRKKYDVPYDTVKPEPVSRTAEPVERTEASSEMPSLSFPSSASMPEPDLFMDEIESVCRNTLIITEADEFIPQSICSPNQFIQ